MNSYNLLIILILLILIIIFLRKKNENYNNTDISGNYVCSFKDSLTNYDKDNKDCDKKSCYAKSVDKNIVIPQRFLSGQSDSILGHEKVYTPEIFAGIYQIGEIDLFNSPRIPTGYNISVFP